MQNTFNKSKHSLVRALVTVLMVAAITMSFLCLPASAESIIGTPFTSYTYWEGYPAKIPVETKASYEVNRVISGEQLNTGNFKEIQHMFSYGGYLYVLDSGNGRLLKFDKNYHVVETITSFDYKGQKITFTGAKGIFIDDKGMLLADTVNKRILCVKDGKVERILTKPNDPAIPATFDYAPMKLIRDNSGYLYVLCEGSYYGIMVYSDEYEFFGFFGANNVKTSFSGAIRNLITSLFETEEKHGASLQRLPYTLLDICIDSEGFISAVNSSGSGQIRVFGLTGLNTLNKKGSFAASSADGYNFADNPFSYVSKTSRYRVSTSSECTSIAADKDGYYYMVDSYHGRIFVYDKNCTLLTVFGGGQQTGTQLGTFLSPSSVVAFGDDLLVSDFSGNNITVFRLTEYGKRLRTANTLTYESRYVEAKPYWQEINKQDKNCQLAYRGLAKAALKEKDYDAAMAYAKQGLDAETYSLAFEEVRNNFISNNFWWIMILVIGIIVGLTALLVVTKKRQITFIKSPKLNTAMTTIIHPFESFKNVKYKNLGSPLIATIMLILFFVTTVMARTLGGFAFGAVDLSNFNSLLMMLGTIGIVLLWVVSNWLVCILFTGKGTMKEVYCSTCYCLMPMLIYNIGYIALSNVLTPSANSPFDLFGNICYLATIVLLLLSITVVHDFSFFKAIGLALLIVIAMAIVGFVLFSMLTLLQNLLSFVIGVYNEIALR